MELIRRETWGAAPPKGRPLAIPTPVASLFLHHSAGPDGGSDVLRGIQKFHQNSRGWSDIAYTWLYSVQNRMWYEGRGPGVAGGHTRNHNRTSHAVCVLGNYETATLPDTAVADLAEWAAWHSTAWGAGTYRPHREVGATACPGKNIIARLPEINAQAAAPFGTAQPVETVRPATRETPPTLRIGSSSDDVRLLQAALKVTVDGKFGPKTQSALRAFQTANGLTPDGICGPATWRVVLDNAN
jgi:hypothetical protein